jgi:hypothetical protein
MFFMVNIHPQLSYISASLTFFLHINFNTLKYFTKIVNYSKELFL